MLLVIQVFFFLFGWQKKMRQCKMHFSFLLCSSTFRHEIAWWLRMTWSGSLWFVIALIFTTFRKINRNFDFSFSFFVNFIHFRFNIESFRWYFSLHFDWLSVWSLIAWFYFFYSFTKFNFIDWNPISISIGTRKSLNHFTDRGKRQSKNTIKTKM